MQQLAFLVLGANAPLILRQLCAQVQSEQFQVVVHCDGKADRGRYQERVGAWRNVRFVEERHDVYWAGFSMVEASISLAEVALEDPRASHFALVSDDAFPLIPPDQLRHRIVTSDQPWIECWRVPQDHIFHQRYETYFYLDSRFSNPRWFETEHRSFSDKDRVALLALELLKARGKKGLPGLWAGKQWWVLDRQSLERVLELHHSDDHLRESFRFSAVPDELYFQTLFRMTARSPATHGNPMHDDFSRNPKPYVFRSIEEVPKIDTDRRLFLRKIAPEAVKLTEHIIQRW